MPAAQGVISIGDPIAPPADESDVEATRRVLEERLNTLTRDLDSRFGFSPIAAAPVPDDGSIANGPVRLEPAGEDQ